MNQLTRVRSARCPSAQSVIWICGYLVAAAVVSWSAVVMKHTSVVPPLAAVQTIRSTPIAPSTTQDPVAEKPDELEHQTVYVFETKPLELTEFESQFADRIEAVETPGQEIRYFNGRAVRPVKTYWMTVTAYSPDERSCGKWADGITASNKSVWTNAMQLVAADTRLLPFGSLLTIEGYANNQIVPVEDRGGAIKGMRLDLLYPTHEDALQWGVKRMPVTVWEYIEG